MSNNDLISREYLRDAFDNLCSHNCKTCRNFRKEGCSFYRCDLIENAPTVKPEKILVANVTFDRNQLEQIVRDRVIEPIKNGELVLQTDKRPQGDWIFDREFTEFGNPYGTYKCSVCGCHSSNKYSFCKDCEADMRSVDERLQERAISDLHTAIEDTYKKLDGRGVKEQGNYCPNCGAKMKNLKRR